MDDDSLYFLKLLGGCVLFIFLLCALVFGIAMYADSWSCEGYQSATGKPTKYVRAECYINDDGAWYSWTEYKNRLVAKGQMAK